MSLESQQFDLGGFSAALSSRLVAEARIARAMTFAWLCGGWAIAFCLIGIGVLLAFYGYGSIVSSVPAAETTARAVADAFRRAELKTTVSGKVGLSPESEVALARGQSVKLDESAVVKLDPTSSIRVVGDLKSEIPQPSKQQLQLDATSGSMELPFTQYTIFKFSKFGAGQVVTGWNFALSDPSKPTFQYCYYEETVTNGVSASQTVAVNGSSLKPSAPTKLKLDFDGVVSNCIWFSGT
jgi:hypothetical protein